MEGFMISFFKYFLIIYIKCYILFYREGTEVTKGDKVTFQNP